MEAATIDVVPKLELKLADIKMKMEIAMKVLEATGKETTSNIKDHLESNIKELFSLYTGYTYPAQYHHRLLPFRKVAGESLFCRRSAEIRQKLVYWYLVRQQVPTKTQVEYNEIKNISKISNSFKWTRIPNTNKAIFIEKTNELSKRIMYLHKIKEYRQQGLRIVYINDKHTKSCGSTLKQKRRNDQMLVAVSSEGIMNVVFTKTLNTAFVMNIFKTQILPSLNETCVFVIEDRPLYFQSNEEINPLTPKMKMSQYLEQRGIPHDPNAHRGELYYLVNKLPKKDNDNLVHLIKGNGHLYIKRPSDMLTLDFCNEFWNLVIKKLDYSESDSITDAIYSISRERCEEIEKDLIETEQTYLNEDILMEATIDKLMTMARYENPPDELAEYSNVTHLEDIVSNTLMI